MFRNARETSFKDCHIAGRDVNISNYNIAGKSVLEILYEKSAPGGFHMSNERYDPPKCHEDTRLTIRQDLLDQVIAAAVSCMLWLYGAAGAGKSAIAQSFAETCQEKGLLIGTFFFFRTAPLRNNADRLAASLVYQLARSIPSTLQYIAQCIETHPAIFVSSLENQLDKLFVQPLHRACEEDSTLWDSGPRLVILDGLDECDTAKAQPSVMILRSLEKVLKTTPIPIVVFVASRPEIHISSTFESFVHGATVQTFRFALNDNYDVDDDIRLYLTDKFKEIKRDHHFRKYLPEAWPLPKDIDSIVYKSSGQFIYAATIIRYIGHSRCKPHERLEKAFNSQQLYASTVRDSPFKELDALYLQIFSGVEDTITTLTILHHTFFTTFMSGSNLSPKTIESDLWLCPGDVELHTSNLTSLMKYRGEKTPIRIFHSSLKDFLMDKQRSCDFYFKQPAVYTFLTKAYIRHLLNPESSVVPTISLISQYLLEAELDQELFNLVAKLESGIITFIRMPISHHMWSKKRGWYQAEHCFSHVVERVHKLKDVIIQKTATNNLTFWDQCLEAIHTVFLKELQVYLTNEATHDFLVLVAFSKPRPARNLPIFAFASNLAMSALEWEQCYNNLIFTSRKSRRGRSFYHVTQKILQNFLLDPQWKYYVGPEHFTRLTLKCLKVVMDNSYMKDIPVGPSMVLRFFEELPKEEQCYIQAICAIVELLPKALESRELIDTLEMSNCQLQWLTNHPEIAEMYQEAVDSYLKTHSSKSDGSTKRRHCSEEPVDAVEDPSTSSHIQKRARRATISDGTHALAESTVEAPTSFEDKGREREREIGKGREESQ